MENHSAPKILSHKEFRDGTETTRSLDDIRTGTHSLDGKEVRLPPHIVNRHIWEACLRHLLSRGKFFHAGFPYLLDIVDRRLIRVDSLNRDLAQVLRRMGLLVTEPHTTLVAKNLMQVGDAAPERPLHHLSYMSPTAIYIPASSSMMLKITTGDIEEVPLATDDVILIADDIANLPPLAELQLYIDELRPQVGNTCTRLVPGLPLTDHLTTRWAIDSVFTPAQAHQMFLTRFLFTCAASNYDLWPLLFMTGPQGSGKSTPSEKILAILHGGIKEATALPTEKRDLMVSATNHSYLVYDNVDSVDPRMYDNTLCHLSTGAELDLARLYETNKIATFQLRNHVTLSTRVNPFDRSDVMRRSIVLDVRPSEGQLPKNKRTLLNGVLKDRPAAIAEYILRAQNILKAHIAAGDKEYEYQSEMAEYEAFTLRCAEYEGTLDETRALWAAHMTQYAKSVTTSNPLVYAVKLWLGKGENARREVSVATLFAELQTVYQEIEQRLSYTSASAIGKHISSNESALGMIGFSSRPGRGGRLVMFNPSPSELEACKALYHDLRAATAVRASSSLQSRSWQRPQPMQLDDVLDDTTDLDTQPYNQKGILQ